MKVFISYRRDDSIVHALLIHDRLAARFGKQNVFMDIEDIDYGENFERKINERLDTAEFVVAVIGPRWSEMLQQRSHGDDYVRHELSRALTLGHRVVPVLVDGAQPPGAGLPVDLEGLRPLNCLPLYHFALKVCLNALIETIQGLSDEEVRRRLEAGIRSQRLAQWTGAGVGLAIFLAAWVALLDVAGIDTRIASATMWLAGIGRSAPWSGEVVLVAIDEATQEHVGRPFDASWRREHAQLVRTLAASGAKTIAFDFFLERQGAPSDDDALVAAIDAVKPVPVVFAVQRMEGDRPLLLPRFAAVAGSAIACTGQQLGYARAMPLAVQRGQILFPSLALAAFSGGGRVEAIDEPQRELRTRLVQEERSPDVPFSMAETVRAPQPGCEAIRSGDLVALQLLDPALAPTLREPPQRIAYERLLDDRDAAARTAVQGKIVLVGLQMRDRDVFGISRRDQRWGVELLAGQIDAIVRGESVRSLGTMGSLALMLLLALAGAFARRWAAAQSRWRHAAIVLAAVSGCGLVAVAVCRNERLLINLPYAWAAFGLAWWIMGRMDKRWAPWTRTSG